MSRTPIVIVTPVLGDANNGNWRTARRWSRFLAADYRVRVTRNWQDGDEALMIALHARRSADSVAAWCAQHPRRPLLLVLTGTDLYRDIAVDAVAQRSLGLADRLVVLNERGARALPAQVRVKATVVLQSCPVRAPALKTRRHLRVLMVGHLRQEKAPDTGFRVVRRLAHRPDIIFDHVGGALEAALGEQARALALETTRYRWLGALSHGATRARIRRAHVLVHPSRMEGGAQVVIEAVRSGTPVIASDIDGNIGLLGEDYDGYFPIDDIEALAAMLERARDDPTMLPALGAQCAARADLFEPAREAATLRSLLAAML